MTEAELEEVALFLATSARDVSTAALVRTGDQLLAEVRRLQVERDAFKADSVRFQEVLQRHGLMTGPFRVTFDTVAK